MGIIYSRGEGIFRITESKEYRSEEDMSKDLDKCQHIIFCETAGGDVPVRDFLLSIPSKDLYDATVKNIIRLDELRHNLKPPFMDYVEDGIYELRSKSHDGITRIFYFFIFGDNIVMTNGYIKKKTRNG